MTNFKIPFITGSPGLTGRFCFSILRAPSRLLRGFKVLGRYFRMKITRLNELKRVKMDMEGARDVWKQVPISKKDGSPHVSFRVFTIEPGGHTPYHTHPFEHLNYMIEGHGALVSETGQEREVRAGDFVLVSPDERHQYRNKSKDAPFIMICAVPVEYE
jgi:quercetin dioxygenase-like cupin family protein